ncbi:MAG: hypothetical protein BMS9Abin25_1410 [Gammaproteobacteria bacterium]|nr:MAG: hypothetical protein BMS9Abin25_1410 [Gammaproteobacteria bacterium]
MARSSPDPGVRPFCGVLTGVQYYKAASQPCLDQFATGITYLPDYEFNFRLHPPINLERGGIPSRGTIAIPKVSSINSLGTVLK